VTRLPRITGREVVAALRKAGFTSILRDCELDREVFITLL
jgi:hypothetical protein